jgi:hypothetical protein
MLIRKEKESNSELPPKYITMAMGTVMEQLTVTDMLMAQKKMRVQLTVMDMLMAQKKMRVQVKI